MAEAEGARHRFDPDERALLAGERFAICVGEFYEDLADRLTGSALEAFAAAGVAPNAVDVHRVPGAFELPLAALYCAGSGGYAGVACLGAVIRGETDHYEHVCAETARGIGQVALQTGVPCGFGVLTCETMEQAIERAGGTKRDQGRDCALAVMRMFVLSRVTT